jgi:hypothetical protein
MTKTIVAVQIGNGSFRGTVVGKTATFLQVIPHEAENQWNNPLHAEWFPANRCSVISEEIVLR